eukprot:m.230275 g.230275  ORF g.230275 m.230275 type:complete len:665 (-) comp15998_c0_seq5:271-2265(-)
MQEMATNDAGGNGACGRELAGRAQDFFEAGNYDKSLSALVDLSKERPKDPKVQHNLAVTRFYAGKEKSLDNFFSQATKAKKSLAGRDADSADSNNEDFDDEAESAVITYNLAVVLYKRRHFDNALSVLERVYKIIEAVEEHLAQKICLLLLDLYIVKAMPEKAGFVLTYLEKTLTANQQKKDAENGENEGEAAPDQDEQKAGNNAEKEKLKFYLHQYKARIHVLTRSMKACKREIKSALNVSSQNVAALFLKSNYEYIRRNYRKSVKLLNSGPKSNDHADQNLTVLYYNNLGCVHLQMQKYGLAGFYFNKAIQANESYTGRSGGGDGKQINIVNDRLHELMYNQGVSMLHLEKPRLAHSCFTVAAVLLSHNPTLWCRMAECCIQDDCNKRKWSNKDEKVYKVAVPAGIGKNRKLIVQPAFDESQKEGGLTLGMAISYLNNALHLIAPKPETDLIRRPTGSKAAPASPVAAVSSNVEAINANSNALLRCHIHANLMYAYLGVARLQEAFDLGESLLIDPVCSGSLRFLAHVYLAEALVRMKKYTEAIRHLQPENIGDLNPVQVVEEESGGDNDGQAADSEQTRTPAFSNEAAKLTLLLNLAATYCMRADCNEAAVCLQQVNPAINQANPYQIRQYLVLSVYVALRRNQHSQAVDLLMSFRHSSKP